MTGVHMAFSELKASLACSTFNSIHDSVWKWIINVNVIMIDLSFFGSSQTDAGKMKALIRLFSDLQYENDRASSHNPSAIGCII
jgi:hypothetical protein